LYIILIRINKRLLKRGGITNKQKKYCNTKKYYFQEKKKEEYNAKKSNSFRHCKYLFFFYLLN